LQTYPSIEAFAVPGMATCRFDSPSPGLYSVEFMATNSSSGKMLLKARSGSNCTAVVDSGSLEVAQLLTNKTADSTYKVTTVLAIP
jgi:hypothetical protein